MWYQSFISFYTIRTNASQALGMCALFSIQIHTWDYENREVVHQNRSVDYMTQTTVLTNYKGISLFVQRFVLLFCPTLAVLIYLIDNLEGAFYPSLYSFRPLGTYSGWTQ